MENIADHEEFNDLTQQLYENMVDVPSYFRKDFNSDGLDISVSNLRYGDDDDDDEEMDTTENVQLDVLRTLPNIKLSNFKPINQPNSPNGVGSTSIKYHSAHVHSLPERLILDDAPLNFFKLFFPERILKEIVVNTNAYAKANDAGGEGREWKDLTLSELIFFLAFVIYRGLFPSSRLSDYWSTDCNMPQHINFHLPLKRVEQIKKYLHVSAPDAKIDAYYDKLQPLLDHVQETSKAYYVPKSNVSVDEMIVRFGGRSKHTFRIKNKPTPEGYKILALCDSGYTYSFLPESRVDENEELEELVLENSAGNSLGVVAKKVLWLVDQLPHERWTFNVYMDNYFSSIPLFKYFRSIGIGACGTVRPNSSKFPRNLRLLKKENKLDWNEKHADVVDDVMAMLWMDNGPVTMLSTIHSLDGPEWFVDKNRRRPRLTSTNGRRINDIFGDSPRKIVTIPKIVDDYNNNMGGVDVTDQLRQYYTVQMRTVRTWFPLFLWLIDTSIINAYILRCLTTNSRSSRSHRDFRKDLVYELQQYGINTRNQELKKQKERTRRKLRSNRKKRAIAATKTARYFTKHQNKFSNDRHDLTIKHLPIRDTSKLCHKCKPLKLQKPRRSNWKCSGCKVTLCLTAKRNCYFDYHNT